METQKLTLDGVSDLPQKEMLERITARLWADPDVASQGILVLSAWTCQSKLCAGAGRNI